MNENDLLDTCAGHGFEWKRGHLEGKPGYFIKCSRLDRDPERPEVTFVPLDEFPNLEPADIVRFVHNGRDVHHMTRVVGYFSRVDNWNKSKVGELKDRQKGDYSFEGV